ncbi:AraC family transcriptional regulator [Rhodococcus koreensis]|uniref:AraC family transcriptional regulator n=1 Tax=Rhodococcus koreensis TaxID=99653 RepID=UPI00366ADA73
MNNASHPLEGHPVLHTGNVDEARQAVTDVYLPHQLSADTSGGLDMVLNAVDQRLFTTGFLKYGAPTTLVMPATETCYHVNMTTAGSTHADRSDGEHAVTAAHSSGAILHPEQCNTVSWTPDAEQIILKIPRKSLESHLSDLLGRQVNAPIDFDLGLDLSTARGASLLATVEFFVTELDRPGGLSEMPMARDQLESFIMSQLLAAGDHPYKDDLLAPAPQVKLGRLKPVVDFIEMNADEPLTPNELARAGSMSVRTLHASFQRCFGLSPMAYVRKVRLEHVREELLTRRDHDPDLRVTDVATRWGFFHLGRFAQQYKERFGESPSDTMRH